MFTPLASADPLESFGSLAFTSALQGAAWIYGTVVVIMLGAALAPGAFALVRAMKRRTAL